MLVLRFDVKCGFENIYIVQKDLEFPLALIKNKTLSNKLFKKDFKISNYTDEFIFENYKDDAYSLIETFDLETPIKFITRLDVACSYLYQVCYRGKKPIIPGICDIDNVRLEQINDDELDFINRELRSYDIATAETFNCFNDEDDELNEWEDPDHKCQA